MKRGFRKNLKKTSLLVTKMVIFWVVILPSFQRFHGYAIITVIMEVARTTDGFLQDYTLHQPRGQKYLYSLSWERETSLMSYKLKSWLRNKSTKLNFDDDNDFNPLENRLHLTDHSVRRQNTEEHYLKYTLYSKLETLIVGQIVIEFPTSHEILKFIIVFLYWARLIQSISSHCIENFTAPPQQSVWCVLWKWHRLDSAGSGRRPKSNPCERGNKYTDSTKFGHFLTNSWTVNFSRTLFQLLIITA